MTYTISSMFNNITICGNNMIVVGILIIIRGISEEY